MHSKYTAKSQTPFYGSNHKWKSEQIFRIEKLIPILFFTFWVKEKDTLSSSSWSPLGFSISSIFMYRYEGSSISLLISVVTGLSLELFKESIAGKDIF